MKVKILDDVDYNIQMPSVMVGLLRKDIRDATDLDMKAERSSEFETDKVKYYFDESKGIVYRNEKVFLNNIKSFIVRHGVNGRRDPLREFLEYMIILIPFNTFHGVIELENLGK